MKTTQTYWNSLDIENAGKWEDVEGSGGNLQQLTIAEDLETGYYVSSPSYEAHGPFIADEKDAIVLEISYPSQANIKK